MKCNKSTHQLTELQSAAVEAYRKRLAENFSDVEILGVSVTDEIVEIRLNYASVKDYSTLDRTTEFAIDIGDGFGVTLLLYVVPH
jgi:hypothetical protein